MSPPIFRFAPSPNGHLHLGHAYSALFTFGSAEAAGGTMLLRIEDTDVARCKPEFDAEIREDLRWLGLHWPEPVWRQSERFGVYAEVAARLQGMGLLYPCFCSRTEVAAAASATDPDGAPIYPGTCKHLTMEERAERVAAGLPMQSRLDMPSAADLAGPPQFPVAMPEATSAVVMRAADPARWGDVVLQRKGTPTSYHLSVVVDDAAQGVTNVTRGQDMEAATDLHVLLQKLLDLPTPIYTFHRLLLGPDGKKLSKSKNSQSLRALREAGWTLEQVRREVGYG